MLSIDRNIIFYEFAIFNQINSLSTIFFFLSFKNRQKRTTFKNILIKILGKAKLFVLGVADAITYRYLNIH